MDQRTGDRLLLDQKPGAYLHFTTHAEGVDTLIADSFNCPRANHLPVIILRAAVDRLNSFVFSCEPKEIETAVTIDVGDVEEALAQLNVSVLTELTLLVAQPDDRADRS